MFPADLDDVTNVQQPRPRRAPRANTRASRARPRPRDEDEASDDQSEEEKQTISILTIGGAHKVSKLWFESSRPMISHFTIYKDDVVAEDASYIASLNGEYLHIFTNP